MGDEAVEQARRASGRRRLRLARWCGVLALVCVGGAAVASYVGGDTDATVDFVGICLPLMASVVVLTVAIRRLGGTPD